MQKKDTGSLLDPFHKDDKKYDSWYNPFKKDEK